MCTGFDTNEAAFLQACFERAQDTLMDIHISDSFGGRAPEVMTEIFQDLLAEHLLKDTIELLDKLAAVFHDPRTLGIFLGTFHDKAHLVLFER